MSSYKDKISMRNHSTYICDPCLFACSTKRSFNKHTRSPEHKIIVGEEVELCYGCGQYFGSRTTLWRHKKMSENEMCRKKLHPPIVEKKICNDDEDNIPSRKQVESLIDTTILTEVLKETRTLREAFVEQTKTIESLRIENERQHRIIEETLPNLGNNITNVMNNNFNINVFLNEHCKNALNLSDFVKSIVVQIEDLEKTKSIGFVRGVTDIIVRNLRQLDIYSRPIHCSDPIQEIMYVKNDNIWHQDKEDKPMVRGAINAVAKKQLNRVKDWEKKNPLWTDSEKSADDYIQIVRQATSSKDDEEVKILRNIAREVVINKSS